MARTQRLPILVLLLLASSAARAQGVGTAWTKAPSVIIVGPAGDARGPLVHAAVAHWNGVSAAIGSAFRLGAVTQRARAGPADSGKTVVVLSDALFLSHPP